jgi:hypothetical protein
MVERMAFLSKLQNQSAYNAGAYSKDSSGERIHIEISRFYQLPNLHCLYQIVDETFTVENQMDDKVIFMPLKVVPSRQILVCCV